MSTPHLRHVVLCSCGLLLLAGCATTQAPVVVQEALAPLARPASASELALAELARLQTLPPQEAALAREVAREALEREPSPARRGQYLMTLLVAPASPADDDRATALADATLNSATTDNDVQRTLTVLATMARENAATRKKLRDELAQQRGRVVNPKRDDREPEVRALKQRVDELEKQLVAIKSIERSVSRR